MNSSSKQKDHPFAKRPTAAKMRERIVFLLLGIGTYFVIACAAYIFGDIFIKGGKKVFEGDGLLNLEFLTDYPQTLHVVDLNGTKKKLSSKKYYALKDKLASEKFAAFKAKPNYGEHFDVFQKAQGTLFDTFVGEALNKNLSFFAEDRRASIENRFTFWAELLEDPKQAAEDFEVKEQEVPAMVSGYLAGFLNQEKAAFPSVETALDSFRAANFAAIESPTATNLSALQKAYQAEFQTHLPALGKAYETACADLAKTHAAFSDGQEPKTLARLADALDSFAPKHAQYAGEKMETEETEIYRSALAPFLAHASVTLQSDDYAYSGGGIFPAIVGTLLLVLGAMAIAITLGLLSAIFLSEYGKPGRLLSLIRLSILNLAGVPSIIFGLFGFGMFVIFLDWNVSLMAGWFTLAFMVLPIIITSGEESLRSIPQGFREGSLALGATKWTMIRTNVLPYALPGILTSSVLGIARVAGETAPIMFTAAYAKRTELPWEGLEHWTDFFFQGVMALPYHIYVVSAKIPQNEYTKDMQYGTAFVFLALVLGLALFSIILRVRMRKKYSW